MKYHTASRTLALLLAVLLCVGLVSACAAEDAPPAPSAPPAAQTIVLDSQETGSGWSHTAVVDGEAVPEYDYTWHCDPTQAHSEVENAPAEYFTGAKPGDDPFYIAHDITYYPSLPTDGFVRKSYDGEQEWCWYYTDGENDDYIFATLPVQGNSVPTQMMHTPEEAYENAVLHITQPGTYTLEGTWHGQIWIDLGADAFTDPTAKVTLILNGVDVTCTVAPALVFANVYECDNAWESRETHSAQVDTSDAGASVVIADGTVNNFTGANIYRMLKTTYKKNQENAAVPVQKKQRKIDAAFYSFMSMDLDGQEAGTGVLNVTSGFEGLDSELHLTFNGGHVNIFAQDDGINVNEDGVSVVTFNGGSVHILAGLGAEGDGVDSNGYLVVNGGTVISIANPRSDSGLDSDRGSYVNGGTVVALGSTMDWAEADDTADSAQVTMNLRFTNAQSSDEAIIVTDTEGKVLFAYDPDKDEVAGALARNYQGAVLSFPGLAEGQTCRVYVGGDVTGTDEAGVYDPATVTGFSDAAKLQSYAGTWESMGRPGMPGGPGGFDPGQLPDDFDPGKFREEFGNGRPGLEVPGRTPPPGDSIPPDPNPPQPMGQPGDGQQPPEMPGDGRDFGGRDFGGMGFGGPFGQSDTALPRTTDFTMTGKVNNFSQVADAEDDNKPVAVPSTQQVLVDGEPVEFAMYALLDKAGNQTNYIRVRDLAALLRDTAAQFDVDWNGSVLLRARVAYTGSSDEAAPFQGVMTYSAYTSATIVDGVAQALDAIQIVYNDGGYTYYQLRDLGKALGFNVSWTLEKGVFIETDKPYSGE